MRNKLRDYFYDRLSSREEKDVQELFCAHAGEENFDDILMGIFDECIESSRKQKKNRFSFRRTVPYIVAVAAVAALVIFIPVSYRNGLSEGEDRIASIGWEEVNVPYGEKQTVTLSDGTVLHLNSGSRLTYPSQFSGDSRTVFLDGEAYLDVAKNSECPFIIKSRNLDVKVTGTSFDFRNFSQERIAELLLMEGSVEVSASVSNGARMVRLCPGDKLRFDRKMGKVELSRFKVESYKTFHDNNALHFSDMEMRDIAKELSRCFNKNIIVMDEKLASKRYFSIFTNNESLDQVLSAMNSDGKMRIRKSGDTIYLQSH